MHWRISAAAGFLLTGRAIPICALVALHAPNCMARRAFERVMEQMFSEPGHCPRIAAIYAIGDALRR